MKKTNKFCAALSACAMAAVATFSLAGCTPPETEEPEAPPTTFSVEFEEQLRDTAKSWEAGSATNPVTGNTVKYKVIKNVTYCETPGSTAFAKVLSLNIYVPENYIGSDGKLNKDGEQGGYTAENAPIIYHNNISGYSGGSPYEISNLRTASKNGWYYNFLERGYVLIFVGARGITTGTKIDGQMKYYSGAPISLSDLKAGIRFLRHNDEVMPGDAEKIISSGVSAGGNMSALLGITGNSDAFDTYLEEIGACMDETDEIFASQDYCPITDLDHAALAYEWFWTDDEGIETAHINISEFEAAASKLMAEQYVEYFNSLGLKDENETALTLVYNEYGKHEGSFFDWMVEQFEASYEAYVEANGDTDSAEYDWLDYDTETKKATIQGTTENPDILKAMMADGYNPRQKVVFSFDTPEELGTSDSWLFGTYLSAKNWKHFTIGIAEAIKELEEDFPEEYNKYYQAYYDDANSAPVKSLINLYSPYYWLNLDETDVCDNFRICVGTQDRDTATTISGALALALRNAGYNAEYTLMWNQTHTDADVANGFEDWVDSLCK